jgi:hypothetical protein
VLLPGACGTIEASRVVQALSGRDCDITSGKSPLGVAALIERPGDT